MGCGVSNVGYKMSDKDSGSDDQDMRLSSCKLLFSHQQLLKLNLKFSNLLDNGFHSEATKDRQTACLGVIVERLIQRLICNVGNLDSRFSSKFLINLEPIKDSNSDSKDKLKYKYLVRLDLVSTPALYPDHFQPPIRIIEGTEYKSLPQGYAKIRVHGALLEQWVGFLSPNGFLRRDKIQKKFLELLTRAAARPSEPFSPAQVDESKHCGSPGKIVDPITLSHILQNPASQQVFFGSGDFIIQNVQPYSKRHIVFSLAINFQKELFELSDASHESRFPDPRDFRIAIVEDVPETRLHISFLSPTAQSLTSDVEITLGIGVAGWPTGTNFPSRLPLDHIDVLLGYQACQLDYYLVPKGPHSSVYCEDRSSVWEIRAYPTEMFLEHHYSPTSVVARVYKILTRLLEVLKARGVKTLNRYILKNLWLFELEYKKRIQHWKPKNVSRRILSILNKLLLLLQNQLVPSYIFPEKNLLLQENTFEDDYVSDREIVEQYLKQLHNDGFTMELEDSQVVTNELENVLLKKWDRVIASMIPPKANRTKRLNVVNNSPVVISYTRQQMEYIALLIREVLKLKNIQRKNSVTDLPKIKEVIKEEWADKEDFIYLLKVMLDQAKQKLITTPAKSLYKKMHNKKVKKLDELLLSYDISASMMLDDIRRSTQMEFNFDDDFSMVVKIMECLYKAMDSDEKVLALVLRPYLNQIFKGSHENCWFLNEWNKKKNLSEFEAIGAFCELVLSRSINPLDGIINSASKGWKWATFCLQIMQAISEDNSTRAIIGENVNFADSGLRLIFTPSPGRTIRCNVTIPRPLPPEEKESKHSTGTKGEKHGADSRHATIISLQQQFESTISPTIIKVPIKSQKLKGEKTPFHIQLREGNPFTLASMETRRQGNHRGLGSIVQALISLQKLTTLQEVSHYLPEDEKIRVLGDIKKLSKEIQRATVENYRKSKNFSITSSKGSKFIVKNSPNTVLPGIVSQRKISNIFYTKTSETLDAGIYRSTSEFCIFEEKDDVLSKEETEKRNLEKTFRKEDEETLRGTCRQLRSASRPTVFGPSTSCTYPKPGYYRRESSKSVINTPFYIRVSCNGCTFNPDK